MAGPYWSVSPDWAGETVVCIGGGASLTQGQVDACRGRARVIAINDAYLRAPWADILYFADARWFGWHKDRPEFRGFGGIKVTIETKSQTAKVIGQDPTVRVLRNLGWDPVHGVKGLSDQPDALVTGCSGGFQAVGLAAHLGAGRVILLGYDMRAGHWHGGHPVATPISIYSNVMKPPFDTLVEPLRKRGIAVVNCTPGSALDCFPKVALEEALRHGCPTGAAVTVGALSGQA